MPATLPELLIGTLAVGVVAESVGAFAGSAGALPVGMLSVSAPDAGVLASAGTVEVDVVLMLPELAKSHERGG